MGMRRAEKSSRNLDLGNLDVFALSVFLSETLWGSTIVHQSRALTNPSLIYLFDTREFA